MLNWPDKDADEVLDYGINWSKRLAGDTIATSAWTVPSGLTKDSEDLTSTRTAVWLSGGATGKTYRVLNRVVTEGGRTMDQTVALAIRNR